MLNTMLYVDDNRDDIDFFVEELQKVSPGTHCDFATCAITAFSNLKERLMNPDLILLDLNMPALNGQKFLTELQKHDYLKHIPVFIFTTSNADRDKESAMRMGASGFITKPGTVAELHSIIKCLVGVKSKCA